MAVDPIADRFFRASRDLLCVVASDGVIAHVNPALQDATSTSAIAWAGSPFPQIAHPEDRDLVEGALARLRAGAPWIELECRTDEARSTTRWMRFSLTVDEESEHWFAVVRDVTAERLAMASAQGRLAQLEARAEQLGMLSDMGELLQSSRGMDDARQVIDLFMGRIFPGHSGAVYVLDGARGNGEILAKFGDRKIAEVIDPNDCWALRRGRPHWSTGEWLALDCGHARMRNLAHVCLPLMAQGEARGLLHLELPHQHDVLPDSAEARFVNAVADHLGLAIANVTLRERLHKQSIRDPLTGCFNRRYLEETLVRELRRCEREEKPLSVAMIDLDHFKHFNDSYGHVAADELLVELGALLRETFRTEDVVCRFGGEEFVVLLPGATSEQALQRVDSLRPLVRTMRAAARVSQPVTFSAGVASAPDHTTEGAELIRAADAAMYLAKTDGRDRVYLARPNSTRPALKSVPSIANA
ncbi:MAG: diguanylate cyclase [Sandaracinaceae bacterium]